MLQAASKQSGFEDAVGAAQRVGMDEAQQLQLWMRSSLNQRQLGARLLAVSQDAGLMQAWYHRYENCSPLVSSSFAHARQTQMVISSCRHAALRQDALVGRVRC